MKYFLLVLALTTAFSCASQKELKQSKECKIWKNSIIGPMHISAKGTKAQWKGSCKVLGLFLCKWVKTEITDNEIFQQTSGLFSKKTKISTLRNETLTYDKTFVSKVADFEPIQIDLAKQSVKTMVKVKALGKEISDGETYHFNKSCSTQEVAIGIVTLTTASNKI